MNRLQMVAFYCRPVENMQSLPANEATQLLHLSRDEGLTASLMPVLEYCDPSYAWKFNNHVVSYFRFAEKQYFSVVHELLELEKVFADCIYPVLLVKGVSYRLAGFEYARYRLFSDIDLLVKKENFHDAVSRLRNGGYIEQVFSEYEKNYYINWSHQYPPMRHILRKAEIDLHHTLFFARSRIQLELEQFFIRAKQIEDSVFYIPSPADMFVHACLHLFYQEENHKLARDLIDLHHLYMQIENKALIIQSASICNKQTAVCYGLMVQNYFFECVLSREETEFIQSKTNSVKIKMMKLTLKSLLSDEKFLKKFANIFWFFRGHLMKMNFILLTYHSLMKIYNTYQKNKYTGSKQKEIDAQTFPKDAR